MLHVISKVIQKIMHLDIPIWVQLGVNQGNSSKNNKSIQIILMLRTE